MKRKTVRPPYDWDDLGSVEVSDKNKNIDDTSTVGGPAKEI